ncbi:MAG: hypothetical protein ACRDMV_01015 [Streptosporangiales bacterium]
MLTVGIDAERVERDLGWGRLVCPGCGAVLARWGYARSRRVREGDGWWPLRPRRTVCTGCGATHVLLPSSCLLRHADGVATIGAAVTANAEGWGHRRIACRLGRPASTVRGWLRAFAARAEQIRAVFTVLLGELDPLAEPVPPAGSALADAVEAIGAVTAAVRRRLGQTVCGWSPWQAAAAVSAGRLLTSGWPVPVANTSWLWAAVP